MRALFLTLLVVFGFAAPVVAYELLGYEWPATTTGYRVNANFPSDDGGTGSEQRSAIRCGADIWRNQAAQDFRFIYQGSTSEDEVDVFDSLNAVFYAEENPGDSILAVTFWGGNADGEFLGFDIVYYDENDDGDIIWNGVGDPESGETDMVGVSTHEFGHALGLDHTDVDDATMVGSLSDEGVEFRTLEEDDIDGSTFLYGDDDDVDTDVQIDDVDPPSGDATGGYEVVILGVNFTWEADTTLTIDGEDLDDEDWLLKNCRTLLIESMPAGPDGFVDIEITNTLGSVLMEDAFEYLPVDLPPVITSVEPELGSVDGGDLVTITGENFTDDVVATLDGEELVDFAFVSSTELSGETPARTTSGLVTLEVVQETGTATLEEAFEYFDDAIRALEAEGAPGMEITADIAVSNSCPLDGYSFGVDFDSEVLEVLEVVLEGTDAADADFILSDTNNEDEPDGGFWTIGVLMDLIAPIEDLLPVGTENTVARAVYLIAEDAEVDSETTIEVRDDIGSPAVPVELVCEGGDLREPSLETGTITIIDGVQFRRGDIDGNGTPFPLVDALYLLQWAFQDGDDLPCNDAADIDDNGTLFPLIDVIALLDWSFNGADPPPDPGPNDCGFDPTDDDLDCVEGCP